MTVELRRPGGLTIRAWCAAGGIATDPPERDLALYVALGAVDAETAGRVARARTGADLLGGVTEPELAYLLGPGAVPPGTPSSRATAVLRAMGDDFQQEHVAADPATPPGVLAWLAHADQSSVRACVAANPSSPARVLRLLAGDDDRGVGEALVRRADLPSDVVAALARDPDPDFRVAVACHPSVPLAVLTALSSDSDAAVRGAAARRLPPTTVEDDIVAAGDPAALPGRLSFLGGAADAAVRAAVAANRAAPESILDALSHDADPEVRRQVASNPSAPDHTRVAAASGL